MVLLYKLILGLDRINLYFFNDDYGKDVTCFLGGVVSVIDMELEVRTVEN